MFGNLKTKNTLENSVYVSRSTASAIVYCLP